MHTVIIIVVNTVLQGKSSDKFDVQITETGWPGCQATGAGITCTQEGIETQGITGGQANSIYAATVLGQMADPASVMSHDNVSVYFFEAFDESTKGGGQDPREPAFGLYKDIKLTLNKEQVRRSVWCRGVLVSCMCGKMHHEGAFYNVLLRLFLWL